MFHERSRMDKEARASMEHEGDACDWVDPPTFKKNYKLNHMVLCPSASE